MWRRKEIYISRLNGAIPLVVERTILFLVIILVSVIAGYGRQKQIDTSASVEVKTADSATLPDNMVWIEGGSFRMGSEDGDDDEKPVHKVIMSGFYMDRTEVTNKQYNTCVHAGKCSPAHYDDSSTHVRLKSGKWKKGIVGEEFRGLRQPVVAVTWEQAKTYCTWKGGRLPTETEWEYACKVGQTTNDQWDYNSNGAYAWYSENANNRTHPVGQKKPNNFGLYDMSGNVWEWCSDWYGKNYYQDSPLQNPQGPDEGDRRIIRGGAWNLNKNRLRCAYRYRHYPNFRNDLLGFRCVR